jgi:hypothetical protein
VLLTSFHDEIADNYNFELLGELLANFPRAFRCQRTKLLKAFNDFKSNLITFEKVETKSSANLSLWLDIIELQLPRRTALAFFSGMTINQH